MSTVAIIGAGLVGQLAADMLQQRGWTVHVFEARHDQRQLDASGRSINLALSPRGIQALHSVDPDLAQLVQSTGTPMRGRMIHSLHQPPTPQDYGNYAQGEFIASISRSLLSQKLLDHLDRNSHATTTHFQHKLLSLNARVSSGVDLTFSTPEGPQTHNFNLVIGCDGAYSKTRQQIIRGNRFNFSQSYAKHAYLELTIPAEKGGGFRMSEEHLHIWPRGEFMLIALPNQVSHPSPSVATEPEPERSNRA